MIKLLVFLFSISIQASSPKWTLQVTDPNFTLHNINLDERAYKAFLKRTSWRCYVSKVIKKGSSHIREFKCNYSIQKAGQFITRLSCSNTNKYGEINIDLYDEKKDLNFSIMLFCKVK